VYLVIYFSAVDRNVSCTIYCKKMDEMSGACNTCWTEEKYIHRFWYWNRKGRVNLQVYINVFLVGCYRNFMTLLQLGS